MSVISGSSQFGFSNGLHASEENVAKRLQLATDTVREISEQTDPTEMVEKFSQRMKRWFQRDRVVSLSRRRVDPPSYQITRSSTWETNVNPWKDQSQLPIVSGGILGQLIYGNDLHVIDDFRPDKDDPMYEYLKGMKSLVAVPLFDGAQALNMVVIMSAKSDAFDHEKLPDLMLQANLFGRATHSLVMASEVKKAYAELDREMKRIGELQQALLPAALPQIPGLSMAVSYETATRAGGDYYDFFKLNDDRWGMVIGDVSGHGASAAVMMAITRTLLHAQCLNGTPPDDVLATTNARLIEHSERYETTFVTAFYAIFDSRDGSLHYASAGHNPPLLMRRDGDVFELKHAQSYPLAILPDWTRVQATESLQEGDTLVLYTDGITEAFSPQGEMYGQERLHACMNEPSFSARGVLDCILGRLDGFTEGAPPQDDRTILTMRMKSL